MLRVINEGNYTAAREKLQKALVIRQAIRDRAGEAGTLFQIGRIAWESKHHDSGIKLIAMCFLIEKSIGHGGIKETLQTLSGMAEEIELDKSGLEAVIKDAAENYSRDRGASLVNEAFNGL